MLRLASKFFPLIEICRISTNLKFFLCWGRKKVHLERATSSVLYMLYRKHHSRFSKIYFSLYNKLLASYYELAKYSADKKALINNKIHFRCEYRNFHGNLMALLHKNNKGRVVTNPRK